MSEAKTVLRVTTRETKQKGKSFYNFRPQSNVIEYVENRKVEARLRFNEISTDETSQKVFVEDHISEWIQSILHGVRQLVIIAGTDDSGKNYLMKGNNSTPGIISSIEKRLAILGTEMTLSSRVSCLRYANNTFWDILNSNHNPVSLACSNDIYSFPSLKSLPLADLKSVSTVESSIHSSLQTTYKDLQGPSIWLFTCRPRSSTISQPVFLTIVDMSITPLTDFDQLPTLRYPLIQPSEPSNFLSALDCIAVSYPNRTLLAVIHPTPSPLVVSFLKAWGTPLSEEEFRPTQEEEEQGEEAVTPLSSQDEDLPITLISSDSFVDSESSESSDLYYQTPKKTVKRVIHRSALSGHVAKSRRFSPSSRSKIYENESRLSQLMNGFPTLSPCSRILQAKQVIRRAREQEAQGRLNEAVELYKEAQELLPDNERLRRKVEEILHQIDVIASVNGGEAQEQNEERVLQILNYAGLSGLLKLKMIGDTKAKKILKERESGLFVSIDDLKRIGMTSHSIEKFKSENIN